MNQKRRPAVRGRGSPIRPPNRFLAVRVEDDLEQLEHDPELWQQLGKLPTEYYEDDSQSIVTENTSPDVGFRYSLNPYRGCLHGCAYCYARNSHQYLGFDAGLDFESKIVVKRDAPRLFRTFLARDCWQPEPICFSGITDCYQPIERQMRLTRGCLEVAQQCGQPISIITKNALVLRDIDLLREMAARSLVHVNLSITTLNAELARVMEPRTSTPLARLQAVRELTAAGIPVRVMLAPIIPGLNDAEIPNILQAAQAAGAQAAAFVLLRLPLEVRPVFLAWLHATQGDKAEKVANMIRQTRQGKFNNSQFGQRMRGTGLLAEQIARLFDVFSRKYRLDGGLPPHDCSRFEPPRAESGQLRLF